MAEFNSSTLAMGNLLIGLSRGYWKKRRFLEKKYRTDLRQMADEVIKLEDDFILTLTVDLKQYFPEHQIKDLATSIIRMAANLDKRYMR